MNSGPWSRPVSTSVDKRHHVAVTIAHVEHAQAFSLVGTVLRFSLDVDLVEATEAIEVVDVGAAEESADRTCSCRQARRRS